MIPQMRGRQPQRGVRQSIFGQFFLKLHEIEKRGAHAPSGPLGSINTWVFFFFFVALNYQCLPLCV